MTSFEGKYVPPVANMHHSVVPIGGPGRCDVLADGLVCEGYYAQVSAKAVATAVGSGLLLWLITWSVFGYLTGNLWDTEIGGYCMLFMIGTASRLKRSWDLDRPVTHHVSFDGIKGAEELDSGKVMIKIPGIRRRGALYFQPDDGACPFLEAVERARDQASAGASSPSASSSAGSEVPSKIPCS